MYELPNRVRVLSSDSGSERVSRMRVTVFLIVFLLVAGGGIAFDYSRPAVYRASARLSVEPPGVDDTAAKAQFAVSEAVAMRRSDIMSTVVEQLGMAGIKGSAESLARQFSAEAVPQTSIIDVRAEGGDQSQLVAVLSAWIAAYQASRKQVDQQDEAESRAEAKHSLQVADKAIQAKRQEIDAFRVRHGITSFEREENPGAARLKGLHSSLNDAAAKEVAAEAKLKAIDDSISLGKGYIRAADRAVVGNLEMRAVELRERMKDLEHDFTQQYLALDPKYKALKANLERLERQIEAEKQRSLNTARAEAQEEFATAQRASQRLRTQVEEVKQDSQSFSVRFVELRRMMVDLEQLQEARQAALGRSQKISSARQPAQVRIQVLTPPFADPEPISPNYARDAGIALGAGFVLALTAVWLGDYLRREPLSSEMPPQPIIQIAYPAIQGPKGSGGVPVIAAEAVPRLAHPLASRPSELSAADVRALWEAADAAGRLIIALPFAGVSAPEIEGLYWRNVDLSGGVIDVPGPSARRLPMVEPLLGLLSSLDCSLDDDDRPLVSDGAGAGLSEADLDVQLVCLAHDAGLRQPESVTSRMLHYTYAAFLARQGIRMTELSSIVGRLSADWAAELIRLSPPSVAADDSSVQRVYPSFRTA